MKPIIKSIMFIFTVLTVGCVFSLSSSAATLNSTAGQVSVTSGNLNIRKSASTSSEIVKTVKGNSYLTLISKSSSWWKVEYANGKYGYCHSDYIKQINSTAKTVNVSSGRLNVRSGMSTSHSIKTTLDKGTAVVVLGDNGTWSKIIYHGSNIGYVSSAYLKSASYQSVKLSVTSFKQTDSRWASTAIGQTGGTIGTIGCTTTCLAMTESYRTGTAINPAQMSQKLSYSASGSLYWPSDYSTELVSSSNYLLKIYNLLKQGKPVIFGMKKADNSSQHWVVVTGYTGADTLTTSNFTVNDPGSNTRVTLSQVMAAYPNVYKIAYAK